MYPSELSTNRAVMHPGHLVPGVLGGGEKVEGLQLQRCYGLKDKQW